MKRVGLVEGQSMTSQSRWYNPGQRVMKEKYTLAVCLQVGSENELAALSLLFLSHSGKYILFGQCVEYLAKHVLTFLMQLLAAIFHKNLELYQRKYFA
jgi:hypothetical protein